MWLSTIILKGNICLIQKKKFQLFSSWQEKKKRRICFSCSILFLKYISYFSTWLFENIMEKRMRCSSINILNNVNILMITVIQKIYRALIHSIFMYLDFFDNVCIEDFYISTKWWPCCRQKWMGCVWFSFGPLCTNFNSSQTHMQSETNNNNCRNWSEISIGV